MTRLKLHHYVTTASKRRHLHLAMMLLWIGPGLIASYIWANSVAWVVFMSWFANVYTTVSAYSAETPVENE